MYEEPDSCDSAAQIAADNAPMDMIFGRRNPLSRLLSLELQAQGHRVFTSALPSLDVSGEKPLHTDHHPVLWLPASLAAELPADCAEGDIRAAARRVAAAAKFLHTRLAVVVTDFSPGECSHHAALVPHLNLDHWQRWSAAELTEFLDHLPNGQERRRFAAYFSLVKCLADQGLPCQVVHCAVLTGESASGQVEHNPVLEDFFSAVHSGKLRIRPGGADLWVPLCAPDFAAAFLARLPQQCPPGAGSLWLYDRRALSLRWLVEELCRLMGHEPPRLSLSPELLDTLGRSRFNRQPGLLQSLHRLTRNKFDNRREMELSGHMGLRWPNLRETLGLSAGRWLAEHLGIEQVSSELPGRAERPTRGAELELALPRGF